MLASHEAFGGDVDASRLQSDHRQGGQGEAVVPIREDAQHVETAGPCRGIASGVVTGLDSVPIREVFLAGGQLFWGKL